MSLELLQDLHLSDDSFWTEFQYYWKNGSYSRALQILEENQELITKYVSAEWFNSLTTFIYQLETLPDDFNKKQIKVSYLPPDLEVGDIWFQLELGEINIGVKMSIIPAGSTSVTTTYSNTLINALAFKNNQEVLVNQVINETNHSVTFSIGESLDYPVICMVYYSNNSNLEINTINFSVGDEMFVVGYSGEILSVMCLQDNNKNIVNIYDYNSNELFFKINPATENGIIRICSIPSANLNEILNVNSENLSGTVLRLTCDGYMVNSILTQVGTLELGINNVSGSVVTFNDGVGGMALKSFTVNIDPVQDLHGYDHPWPAGGGKNKLNIDESVMEESGYNRFFPILLTAGTYTITAFSTFGNGYGSAIDLRDINKGNIINIASSYAFGKTAGQYYTFTLTEEEANAVAFLMMRVNGSGISFADIEAGKLQIESGSSSTSWAPYSNECPISGWSAANVWRTGKNLFDVSKSTEFNQNVTLTFNADGSMTCKNDNSYAVVPTVTVIILIPPGTYTVSSSSAVDSTVALYASDDGVTYSWYANGLSQTVLSRTVIINKPYIQLRWQVGGNTTATLPPIQLELGSTATPYEPYSGNQYTIQLGQTVYGATLDVTNGVLTVDKGMVDLGTLRWSYSSSVFYNSSRISNFKLASTTAERGQGMICSEYPFSATLAYNENQDDFSMLRGNSSWDVRIKDSSYNGDANAFKTAMNGVQLVYELATPITIPITPTQINTLLGQNNIWADTGDTSLEYYTTSDSPFSTEELTLENFVLSDISFELNKAIISKNSNDSTIKCTLYYT